MNCGYLWWVIAGGEWMVFQLCSFQISRQKPSCQVSASDDESVNYDNLSQCVPKFLFQQVSTFWVPNRGFLFPARFVVFSFQSVTYMLKQPFHFENLFCFSGSSGPPVTANLILFNCGRTRIKKINADCNILRLSTTTHPSSLQSFSLNRLVNPLFGFIPDEICRVCTPSTVKTL